MLRCYALSPAPYLSEGYGGGEEVGGVSYSTISPSRLRTMTAEIPALRAEARSLRAWAMEEVSD